MKFLSPSTSASFSPLRSARDQKDMERLRDEFKARFPESEGFGVHVTHWQAKGTVLE